LEAQANSLGGIAVWGFHRDTSQLIKIGFPVFSYGAFPVGPKRAYPRGSDALTTARFGDFKLTADDVVFGDDDGVVFALLQDVEDIISLARTIAKTEKRQAENIKNGKTLSQQLKFDEYLKKRSKNSSYSFREHLLKIGGAIEV
jgi:regulator of RNase E activity RraA